MATALTCDTLIDAYKFDAFLVHSEGRTFHEETEKNTVDAKTGVSPRRVGARHGRRSRGSVAFSFTLIDVPDRAFTYALGINDRGQVVGDQ